MVAKQRLKARQAEAKKRQQPRCGKQANASVDKRSEEDRRFLALAMLATGTSAARVAIHDKIQLPIETVQMLADALAYATRKSLSVSRISAN